MVKAMPAMVDMAIPPEDSGSPRPQVADGNTAVGKKPIYPFGLSTCMCDRELDKVGIDPDSLKIGDVIPLLAWFKVTSISKNDAPDGPTNRVEFQITHLGDPAKAGDGDESPKISRTKALYR